MNEEIKKKWVEALRSGEYRQGRLRLAKGSAEPEFCCLGVLCDLYRKNTGGPEWVILDGGVMFYLKSGTVIPEEVRQWAALESRDPQLASRRCSYWNDESRKTFNEIADMIETSPEL